MVVRTEVVGVVVGGDGRRPRVWDVPGGSKDDLYFQEEWDGPESIVIPFFGGRGRTQTYDTTCRKVSHRKEWNKVGNTS